MPNLQHLKLDPLNLSVDGSGLESIGVTSTRRGQFMWNSTKVLFLLEVHGFGDQIGAALVMLPLLLPSVSTIELVLYNLVDRS